MTKRHGPLTRVIQRSYLRLSPAGRAMVPAGLRGRVRDWLGLGAPGRKSASRPGAPAERRGAAKTGGETGGDPLAAEKRLWSGYARDALVELEALAGLTGAPLRPDVSRVRQAEAAWALARWYAAAGDPGRALRFLERFGAIDRDRAAGMRGLLLGSDCLRRRGSGAEARRLLAPALAKRPDDANLCLAMANSYLAGDYHGAPAERDAIRLDCINRIYRARRLAEITLRDPARGLRIDNLTASAPPEVWPGHTPETMSRVSVIMPLYKAEATLPFALESLLAQSWPNLEIIVVDDASPDGTAAVAEGYAARDPRVKVLRQAENRGGYAARNRGWLAATGDFITTHDADDWSHPEKIARQMRFLRDNPAAPVCFSDWVRATPELGFGWLFRAWSRFSGKSMSSILIPRPMMERLGGWDVARVGGDTEILRRVQHLSEDPDLSPQACKGVPLAFALHAETSLTRQSATHVRTMLYGARREYAEASDHWRRTRKDPAELRLDPEATPASPRPFPAPLAVLGRSGETRELDLLVITDFAMKGGSFVSTFNTLSAAVRAGMRVGVFHWRRYDLDMTKPLDPRLRALVQRGEVAVISAGEKVRAATVVFGYPVILTRVPDPLPEIDCDAVIIVVNQMAERMTDGGDPQYDPRALQATVRDLFGREAVWAPISGLVQRLMRADPRYPAPSDEIWVPLIETEDWCAKPPRWRGGSGAKPVIGRHARDEYTKWPSDPEALRAAYCAERPCVVELMGGAGRARDVIGAFPSNWVVHSFGTMDSHAFLDRLDFFLHYPHETYIEEFGRAVLEALARGLPAVLPPVFRETFGEAAVYAEPEEVWPRIAALWADEAAYLAQAVRGQEFVRAHSDWSRFPARLAATLGRGPGTAKAGMAETGAARAAAQG